ncbi:MAG: glycerol dehydrogenase [Peptococcaceae bacterium]|nr:glycerol dehydrogenase [Peptococcaceae bacterium]
MTKYSQIFIASSKYVQGRGVINQIGEHISLLGDRVLVVGGKTGLAVTRSGRAQSLAAKSIFQVEELFRGEVCDAEIERLTAVAKQNACNVLVACGGGKAIDAVKAAAAELKLPAVIIPTTAATDAPCSALSVIYKENGEFDRLWILPKNPDLVLVDTEIICQAPVRLLVAGMGDALATWFEAEACYNSGALNISGGKITASALALARLCYDILLKYGLQAKIACESKLVTPALEKVVEANTLLSGLGFESGGTAAAHAISEGFSLIEEMHDLTHGEKVAFCTLVQLILEQRPPEIIQEVYDFCYKLGLPITLADLNSAQVSATKLRQAAEISAEPGRGTHNLTVTISGDVIFDAIMLADALGQRIKNGQPIV